MEEAEKLIDKVGKLIPEYMKNQMDKNISQGNVAICIIDEEENIFGKIFGLNANRGRESFRVAWTKASQVWITGYKTGEFEKLAFNNKINEEEFGIARPDYIGWEGGQPVVLRNGKKLSIGFSGFCGNSDLEIVTRAVNQI